MKLKLLLIPFVVAVTEVAGQDLNGIYSTIYTSFVNPSDSSKDYERDSNDLIVIDYNESGDRVKGYFTINSKGSSGESISHKFRLIGDKKVDYENGFTKILFNTRLIVLNEEVENQNYQILLSLKSEDMFLTVFFPGDTYQSWMLNEKL